jgi:hypothetical protein
MRKNKTSEKGYAAILFNRLNESADSTDKTVKESKVTP